MKILLTNDDGINAPGIKALWQELSTIADISVVAPDSERSASSQAITVHSPIRVDKHIIKHYDIPAWRISGTPTDCVKIAIEALLIERPDFIISGINRGSNLGTDVLYSGTVSAAIEGVIHDIPSIAVSLDTYEDVDYAPAAKFTHKLILAMKKNKLPPNTLLNVNVPAVTDEEIDGYVITKLGSRQYENVFERRIDPRGRIYYWMGGNVIDSDNESDTDVAVVKTKKISITPIHFDLTNYNLINLLQKWEV